MRLGVVFQPNVNAYYRAVEPLKAMERRGHEVIWPRDGEGKAELQRLMGCDVVHVYRRVDDGTKRVLKELVRCGTRVTYDNDDDYTAVPKESPQYRSTGGLIGQRIFAETVKLARQARVFTTTNRVLADKYRQAGVERVEVVGNYLAPGAVRPAARHDGIMIGWVAGQEHRADLARIPIVDALERIVEDHNEVRVESVGAHLGLRGSYRHESFVPFPDLPDRIAGFDIGIAPLADIPCNRARSDIKLKEYAACGVPWLASPVGPYTELGEREGGRLVADDGWYEALSRLVDRSRERRRLARRARAWAKGQTIDCAAAWWEQVFAAAAAG